MLVHNVIGPGTHPIVYKSTVLQIKLDWFGNQDGIVILNGLVRFELARLINLGVKTFVIRRFDKLAPGDLLSLTQRHKLDLTLQIVGMNLGQPVKRILFEGPAHLLSNDLTEGLGAIGHTFLARACQFLVKAPTREGRKNFPPLISGRNLESQYYIV